MEKEALIGAQAETFFDAVELDELTELLTDAWRIRAPTRLRDELDRTLGGRA